jgi:hypothetical protein
MKPAGYWLSNYFQLLDIDIKIVQFQSRILELILFTMFIIYLSIYTVIGLRFLAMINAAAVNHFCLL